MNTINQIKQNEIVALIGVFNSLKAGEYTIDGMFDRKKKAEVKPITKKEFDKLLIDLKNYNISLKSAVQKYKDSALTDDQKKKIEQSGTITEKRFEEIIKLVISEQKDLNYFDFYLNNSQMELLKGAVIDNAMKDEK